MLPAFKKASNFLDDDIVELSTENDSLQDKTCSYDVKYLEEPKAKLLKQTDDEKEQNYLCLEWKNSWINFKKVAYVSYKKLWESKFDNIVSKRDRLQNLNNIQLKLEVHDTNKKDDKIRTNFNAIDDKGVINKSFLDEKFLKINGHLSISGKDYNEFELQYNKQSVEGNLIQRAVKTTIQIIFDNVLLDALPNADKAIKDFLFTKRLRPDLQEVNDVSQRFCYYI